VVETGASGRSTFDRELEDALVGVGLPSSTTGALTPLVEAGCSVGAWAASGAMALTGHADGPPLAPRPPVVTRLAAAARAVEAAAGREGAALDVDPARLLTARAAARGFGRQGRRSAGGRCWLLPAADGWVAVNLARPDDVPLLLGAGLGLDVNDGVDPVTALAPTVAAWPAAALAARSQLLGLPVARLPARVPPVTSPFAVGGRGASRRRRPGTPFVVLDLTAMWAGPLAAHLLAGCGAKVLSAEDPARPDAARLGDPALYTELHEGHGHVALDLATAAGRRDLADLVAAADVVIESSRPRALQQLGVDARRVVAEGRGKTWVSITGYGRRGAAATNVAFGDDAAVAGGLVARDAGGDPVFCADAVADPITGLYAALGALASLAAGGGHLVDVPMRRAVAYAARGQGCPRRHVVERDGGRWVVHHGDDRPVMVRDVVVDGVAP